MAYVEFPSTMWSGIRAAGKNDPMAADGMSRRYHPAVVSFLQQAGFSHADSEDLAQDVFVRLFREQILTRADRERGRFRTLLITVTKQVMFDELRKRSSLKRGGGVQIISMEKPPELEAVMTQDLEEEDFDRCWAANLISLAMNRLAEECAKSGKFYHAVLHARMQGKEYKEIAESLGTSVKNISTWVRRAKMRMRTHVEEEIRAYSSSTGEFQNDMVYLKRYIAPEQE